MNKAELRKKIKDLEGLTNEEKSALLELLNKQKKYGLVWEEKTEDVEERLRDHLPVLKEDKEKYIPSDNPDAPNHILIEGDNLEALTALSYTHEGKIDVIYIDPPYNTGKKNEFKYNDNWVDKDDLFKHSKWCSYIKKRLLISKKLLSSNGVIFISIDDHEFANLKSICDGFFLEKNFICNFVWDTEGHTDNQDIFTNVHEYILCYSLKKENISPNSIVDPNTEEDSKILRDFAENSITKNGGKNPPSEINLPAGFPCEIESLDMPISQNIDSFMRDVNCIGYISRDISKRYTMKYPVLLDELQVRNNKTVFPCRVFSGWMNPDKLKLFIKNKCVPIKERDKGTMLRFFLSKNGVIYYRREGRTSHYVQTILQNMGTTETNKYLLENMGVSFEHPKPIELIHYLLSLFAKESSIILDFFAGSGTTLHATMQLNSEDGGHRQCILVTNNENNICKEVTYERNKRVINGYTTPKGEKVEGLHDNKLRYYKTKLLPRTKSPSNMRTLMAAATELLCIKEGLYEEKKTFGRYRLNPKAARYFEKGERRMLIVYCEELADQIAEEIKTLDFGGKRLKIYIFSPDRYAFDDNFFEVENKVQLVALPAAIYDAYRRVLPKKVDKVLLGDSAGETPMPTVAAQPVEQNLELYFE